MVVQSVLGFSLPAFVLANMFVAQPLEALTGLGFIAAGAALYFALRLHSTGPAPVLPAIDVSPVPRSLAGSGEAIKPVEERVR